jgi:hypothetical protein
MINKFLNAGIVLAIAFLVISGISMFCTKYKKDTAVNTKVVIQDSILCIIPQKNDIHTRIYIYTIDSCEYIGKIGGASSMLAHKGNCKYCQARLRKMIRE